MKQNASSPRVNEIAREAIASILLFEVSDPRLDMITVTGCEVSIDRSICHVYVSSEADRYDEVMQGLASAKPRIRSLMGNAYSGVLLPTSFFISIRVSILVRQWQSCLCRFLQACKRMRSDHPFCIAVGESLRSIKLSY